MRRLIASLALFVALAIPAAAAARTPTTPIRHIVVLMQENHSFDNYFGTYPGADGPPPGTCLPRSLDDPALGCVRPRHVGGTAVLGLSSDPALFLRQYRGGRMDGFASAYRAGRGLGGLPNPLGYYDDRDLPFAWNLAGSYVLFDRFFSSARGGSAWNHMFAITGTPGNYSADALPAGGYRDTTTIFDRLEHAGVTWRFYVKDYDPTNTIAHPALGDRASQLLQVPLLAMPRFVHSRKLASRIGDVQEFYRDAQAGHLPAVSYIAPGGVSEHPPGKLIAGQTFVRTVVDELMRSPEWSSTAFVLTYDSWGGWYDHVPPPSVDRYGYGFRVPALLVSPYAKHGAIDHETLDFTSILRFIEDNWRLAPMAARDARANSIASAFDFAAPPRPPEFVSTSRTTTALPRVRTGVVYWAYGAAALLACVLTAVALVRSRPGGASRLRPASRPVADFAGTPHAQWDRLPDEPDAAWRAFEQYRDMGRDARSQRALCAALLLDDASSAPPAAKIRRWSVEWHWVARCRAFDAGHHLEAVRGSGRPRASHCSCSRFGWLPPRPARRPTRRVSFASARSLRLPASRSRSRGGAT
jgi:phospholipase C